MPATMVVAEGPDEGVVDAILSFSIACFVMCISAILVVMILGVVSTATERS